VGGENRAKDCNFSLKPKTTKMSPGCGANKKNKNAKPTEYHNKNRAKDVAVGPLFKPQYR